MANCPECEAVIEAGANEIEVGEVIECPECGAELEIVRTVPLEFDLVESDDWEDDDEEYEDDWE